MLIKLTKKTNSTKKSDRNFYAILFVTQAGCINAAGIISVLSGVPLILVVLLMMAQGGYLVIDAKRFLDDRKN